jgi:hypothetical protein
VLAASGQTDEARKLLTTLKNLVHSGSAFPTFTTVIQIGLGQRDEALRTLEEMVGSNVGTGLDALDQCHIFDEFKTDSRYQKFLAETRETRMSPTAPNASAWQLREA